MAMSVKANCRISVARKHDPARWNQRTGDWFSLRGGMGGCTGFLLGGCRTAVHAIYVDGSDIYVAGNFTKAGATDTEKESARKSVESAWLGYLSAQMSRDGNCGTSAGTDTPGCQSSEAQYGNAFESWVAARSRMRWRARSGTRWTKPSKSWYESRKPRPRPMPDSRSR